MKLRLITVLMTSVTRAVAKDFYKVDLYGAPPRGFELFDVPGKIVATVVCGEGSRATLHYTHGLAQEYSDKEDCYRQMSKGPPHSL